METKTSILEEPVPFVKTEFWQHTKQEIVDLIAECSDTYDEFFMPLMSAIADYRTSGSFDKLHETLALMSKSSDLYLRAQSKEIIRNLNIYGKK
jgi:hypothetical protein